MFAAKYVNLIVKKAFMLTTSGNQGNSNCEHERQRCQSFLS